MRGSKGKRPKEFLNLIAPYLSTALGCADGNLRNAGSKDDSLVSSDSRKSGSPEKKGDRYDGSGHGRKSGGGSTTEVSSREMLEAAARSLRTKFDHVGIDPHSSPDRDVRAIAENRGMTNSPPPPSLAMSAAASNMALSGHSGVAGFVRHLHDQSSDHGGIARVPSPLIFSGGDSAMHSTTHNMHMLQLHHAATLAGIGSAAHSHLDLTIDTGNPPGTKSQGNFAGSENPDLEVSYEGTQMLSFNRCASYSLLLLKG